MRSNDLKSIVKNNLKYIRNVKKVARAGNVSLKDLNRPNVIARK